MTRHAASAISDMDRHSWLVPMTVGSVDNGRSDAVNVPGCLILAPSFR
jgi:hypothetical protein